MRSFITLSTHTLSLSLSLSLLFFPSLAFIPLTFRLSFFFSFCRARFSYSPLFFPPSSFDCMSFAWLSDPVSLSHSLSPSKNFVSSASRKNVIESRSRSNWTFRSLSSLLLFCSFWAPRIGSQFWRSTYYECVRHLRPRFLRSPSIPKAKFHFLFATSKKHSSLGSA